MPSPLMRRCAHRTRTPLLILALLLLFTLPINAATAAPGGGGPTPTYSDLIYGTYLGGSGFESYPSIGVDAAGNAYVAGSTFSKDFPGFTYGSRSSEMVTVASISPDGRRLNYVGTISGGRGTQLSQGIAVTADGTAYITGVTNAKDFPVTPDNGAMDCGRNNDIFLIILDPAGGLRYSGCWGGTNWDQPLDLALTPDGDVVITGYTYSPDFPTTPGAFQSSYVESYDAFVLKLHREGGTDGATEKWTLVAATLLGGNGDDRGYDVEAGADGRLLVTGQAGDSFPVTAGAYQTERVASIKPDAFVTLLAPDLRTAVFSTYLGGAEPDFGKAAALAADGVLVSGWTKSRLPVSADAFDPTGDLRDGDVFVAKLDPSGRELLRSTYLGLAGRDEPSTLLVDETGTVTLSGVSQAAFPTTPGSFDPTANGLAETWLCRLDPELRTLIYSTVVGGSGLDGLRGFQGNTLRAPVARLAGDGAAPGRFSPNDSFYLATITFSKDWPISGTSFQSKLNYQWDFGIVRMVMGELQAVRAGGAVRSDGRMGDWRGLPGLTLNSRNAAVMGLRPAQGSAAPTPPSLGDASGRLQMQWAPNTLYIAATIADNDVHVPVDLPGVSGMGGGGARPGAQSDAVELSVEVRGVKRTFVYPSESTEGAEAVVQMPNGWAVEAEIPATSLGASSFAAGDVVKLTWTIIDEDTGKARQTLTLTAETALLPWSGGDDAAPGAADPLR